MKSPLFGTDANIFTKIENIQKWKIEMMKVISCCGEFNVWLLFSWTAWLFSDRTVDRHPCASEFKRLVCFRWQQRQKLQRRANLWIQWDLQGRVPEDLPLQVSKLPVLQVRLIFDDRHQFSHEIFRLCENIFVMTRWDVTRMRRKKKMFILWCHRVKEEMKIFAFSTCWNWWFN